MKEGLISIASINAAIVASLKTVPELSYVVGYEEIPEAIVDSPLTQVYPMRGVPDFPETTDRVTFSGKTRRRQIIYHVDIYATQRNNLGEDIGIAVPLTDAVNDHLEEQKKPIFGLNCIQVLNWTWEGVVFQYGATDQRYTGIRFILTLRVM